jgi:hypothetical protein
MSNKSRYLLALCLLFLIVNVGTGVSQEERKEENDSLVSLIMGGWGGAEWQSINFTPAELADVFHLTAYWGWRKPFKAGGYISALIDGEGYITNGSLVQDTELIHLASVFPVFDNKMELNLKFSSSISGINNFATYFQPAWEWKYRFMLDRKKTKSEIYNPTEFWFNYMGHLLSQPSEIGDNFFEGVRLGFSSTPSIDFEFDLSLGGGWKYWHDYPVYDVTAALSNNKRYDLIFDLKGMFSGLWGFYADWKLMGVVKYTFSNANCYITNESLMNQHSEDNISILIESELNWSPVRNIEFNITIFGQPEFYLFREALTSDGKLLNEKLYVFYFGSELRLDWTPNNWLYLVFEGEGGINLANDPAENTWFIKLNAGIELSF